MIRPPVNVRWFGLAWIVALTVALVALGPHAGATTTPSVVAKCIYDSSASSRVDASGGGGAAGGDHSSKSPKAIVNLLIPHGTQGSSLPGGSSIATEAADDLVNLVSPARRTHILDGEVRSNGSYGGGHRGGTGFPGKSEFPTSWSDDQVMHHISDVATDPASQIVRTQGRDVFVRGTRDEIEIEVLIRNGEIWTGYPTNVPRSP